MPYPANDDFLPNLDEINRLRREDAEISEGFGDEFDLFGDEGTTTVEETDAWPITKIAAGNSCGELAQGCENDPRTDYWGALISSGRNASCPRARAGLCSISQTVNVEERGYQPEVCSQWPLGAPTTMAQAG